MKKDGEEILKGTSLGMGSLHRKCIGSDIEGREVMEGSRGVVRIVAPGQIETSPLLHTPSPDDFLLYLTTGPLSQLSHLLL